MENRKNQQPIKRPLKPSFGYILSSDPHDLTASLAPNYNNPNVASPTPTDPGQRLHSPFGSNGPSPSHSPISVDLTMPAHKRIPQQTCRKIDSYYRKTNENYLKSVPKTERQKSKIKRIAQLDDAIFELEQMYKKLKLSDQDLLDRAERRDLPTKFQLMRFSSASQMPPISPTPMTARSDEEQPQPPNQSNNELNKRRPISAFYNQFQFQQQRTPPVRRSAVPDLVADDQAVRRLNSPLPPRTPTSSFQTLHQNTPIAPASAYLDTTPAYANQLQMQHSKKKNIYGRLEFDPIVDDVQYRKLSQNQSNVPAPHPPIGTPLNAHHIKPNPTNDYLHSLKSNDMAVRTLRKDKDYSVNQSNPFAKVLHHSGQGFYRDDDDLLPETTSNYLVNMKKQLKPTRSMILVANLDEGDQPDERTDFRQTAVAGANPTPVQLKRPFVKSSSLSNCLLGQQEDEQAKPQKPKNNIYRKPSSAVPLRNEEEQLEDLLSNLNQIPKIKSPDVVSANRFGIISRPSNNRDESGRQQHPAGKEPATELSRLELQQASLAKMMPSANENERTFGLVKSPTEFMNQPVRPQRVVKSRTHGSLSNEQRGRRFVSDKYEQLARGESNRDPTQDTTDQRCGSKNRLDKREELELIKQQKEQLEQEARSTSPKSIWPSQIKKQQKAQKEQKLKSSDSHLDWPANLQTNSRADERSARPANSQVSSQTSSQPVVVSSQATPQTAFRASAGSIVGSQQQQQPASHPVHTANRTPKKRSLIFTRSASVEQPPSSAGGPAVVPYYLPERSKSQVNKMKNLFEAKLDEHLHSNASNRFESRGFRPCSTKKSSTQPDLMTNYNDYNDYAVGESDKKQKKPSKLRKLKSAHSLLSRSLQLFKSKPNPKSNSKSCDDYDHLQFSDESEHETSESDSSSLSSRQEF